VITFDRGTTRFNYRVAGIAFDADRVLLQQARDCWFLPGGRCELLESSQETLRREMHEERGVEAHVERLLWVVENFFWHDGVSYHELGFYFLMHLPHNPSLPRGNGPFVGREGEDSIFKWHYLDSLERAPLYPSFLWQSLQALPVIPQHIVHRDTGQQKQRITSH
jgi:8-oxo-dGTP pyrophosphatase MutT (NUDIX family)